MSCKRVDLGMPSTAFAGINGDVLQQRAWGCRYNTYVAHFKECECMRLELEPVLYEFGVDVVFTGCATHLAPSDSAHQR